MKTLVSREIEKAVSLLTKGEIIAIPTETVYGLAGNIYDEEAIRSIFLMKGRPFYNPLIVHIADQSKLESLVSNIPQKALLLADKFWPGPMTLVLKKKDVVPDLITAGKDTVAIRMPEHPLTLELLKQLDFPIAAPSANPFGRISPTKAEHVMEYFNGKLKMILDGGVCSKGIESTIIGFEGEQAVIYRLGSLSKEEIEKVVGSVDVKNKAENNPAAPGMLSRHYAPKTPFLIVKNTVDYCLANQGKQIAILEFRASDHYLENENVVRYILSGTGSFQEAASNLYKSLHDLDKLGVDVIICELLPDQDLGRTINDRLRRAAKS